MDRSASSGSLSFIQRVGLGTGQVVLVDMIAGKLFSSSRPSPERQRTTSITSLVSYIARVAALTTLELTLKQQLYRQYRANVQQLVNRTLARLLPPPPQQDNDNDSSRLERLRTLLMLQSGPTAPDNTAQDSDDGCPVCFEPVTDIRVAGCRHPICSECAKRMCVSQSSMCCPMCRGPLEFEAAHHDDNNKEPEETITAAAAEDACDDCTLDELVMLEEWMREAMPTTVMLI